MHQFIIDLEKYSEAGALTGEHTQDTADTVAQFAAKVKRYRAMYQTDEEGNPTVNKVYKVTPCIARAVALSDAEYAELLALYGIQ